MAQLTTFLAQNKFYSAVDIPSAAGSAGASAPAPTPDAPADFSACTALTRTCPNRDVRMDEAASDASSERQATAVTVHRATVAADLDSWVLHGAADGASRTEGECGSIPRPAPISDCIGLLFYHARRLALPRFAPDYEAIWNAMHDPNAPRMLAGDPVWADPKPLFLRDA